NNFEYRNMKTEMYCSSRLHEHLETFKSYEGSSKDSLFTTINRTKTPGGARQLKKYLQFPLKNQKEICARWDKIDWWIARPALLDTVQKTLSSLGDGERKLGKITHSHCHGRDILSVGEVLSSGLQLHALIKTNPFHEETKQAEKLKNQIFRTIQPSTPISFKEGGVINKGVRPDLDECINMTRDVQSLLSAMEQAERKKTGIPSLKIRYNNVFGYYIEITKAHSHKVPSSYNRKQTLVHAERYITPELQTLEGKVLSARARQIQIEQEIFQSLRQEILNHLPSLLKLCHHWNQIDVFSSLAFSAIENKYVRPSFGDKLYLVNNRHPVLERNSFGSFVPNTVEMNLGETLILTGPNMAGKSTLMRGVALTVLLAQSGSFVPADKAVLPVFHKLFTRIGANDSLSRGLSTFMVEMNEMAEILEQADGRSLVILDEIGRGTATFDGMSLARAILEFLTTEKKSILLSATHYHELTALSEHHPSIHNGSMNIEEKEGEIHFLYTLSKGPANKSYGIQVARLAGLPPSVIREAEMFLQKYESSKEQKTSSEQMNLFPKQDSYIQKNKVSSFPTGAMKSDFNQSKSQATGVPSKKENSLNQSLSEIEKEISKYSLNEVTPLDAMNQILRWQKDLKKKLYS
ncbi:MAG: DNA mismatch repair protein MutS, partial [Bdellovibrionales bacterium]|nr:DNA mismatch repair protein MutS [Bdellovibrionales bacterium]